MVDYEMASTGPCAHYLFPNGGTILGVLGNVAGKT